MERREQRVRRERKKDSRRNTFQKDEEKETSTKNNQKPDPANVKSNDPKNTEVTSGKSATKDNVIEDDPLRFANLKRETDEIAALKAKKPQKRQVFSNWWKYEEPLPSVNESQAVDFETLLHAPQSGNFKFKSEAQWDTGTFGQYGELFMPDAELLVAGLTSIPFYTRLGIDKTLLLEDEVSKMDTSAKANSLAYEKVNKSKQKPKQDVTDLFKIDYSDGYSVVDKENVPPRETVSETIKSKPQFLVEQSPEPALTVSSLVKPPSHIASDNLQFHVSSRESTPVKECALETIASQDLLFRKPTPPPSTTGSTHHSPLLSRESTPAEDSTREMAPQEFHFAKPPLLHSHVVPNNLQCSIPSRESTPAKEIMSTPTSQGPSFGSPSPPPVSCTRGDIEETGEDSEVREIPPASAVSASGPVISSQNNVPSKEGTPVRESNATLSLDKVPSKEEVGETEDTLRKPLLQEYSADIEQQSLEHKNLKDGNLVSEQKPDENDLLSLDSFSKKGGKAANRKQDSHQKGGGRHGRRKKGQQSSAQEREQLEVDVADGYPESVQPENRPDHTKLHSTSSATNAALSIVEEAGSDKPCPPAEVKKKPERPPPPVALQQQNLLSSQASPTAVVSKNESAVTSTPEKQESQQMEVVSASSDKQAQLPHKKIPTTTKQADDEHLNFLMSLKGQKGGSISEVEATKSLKNTSVSRSAIEEDELRESEKPKLPPVITTEKKEDLEDWLDSMLDD